MKKKFRLLFGLMFLMALAACSPANSSSSSETNTWDFPIPENLMFSVSTQDDNIIKCRETSGNYTFAGYVVNTYSDNRVKIFAYYGGTDKRNGEVVTSQEDIDTLYAALTYFKDSYSFTQNTDNRHDVVADYLSKVNKIYKKYHGGNQPASN